MEKLITLLLLCLTLFGCAGTNTEPTDPEVEVIVVRVPPFHNPTHSRFQNYLLFQRFLFPSAQDELHPIDDYAGYDALPNDDSLLYLTLGVDGQIQINNEPQASAEAATARLTEVFENRTKMGVFEPESERIVKAVGIRVPPSAKYADLVRTARIAESSGADPIILLLDGHLPPQFESSL